MSNFWHYISFLGVKSGIRSLSNRAIMLTNQINFVMICLLFLVILATAINRGISGTEATIYTKRLMYLFLLCLLNIIFSYFSKHNITKVSLIFAPSLILVFLPIFTGNINESDFIDTPLIILSLSFIPPLIVVPRITSRLYIVSTLFFLIQVLFLDTILVYFSPGEFDVVTGTPQFHFFYKLVFTFVFIFIQMIIYYLRNINQKFEIELLKSNEALLANIDELKATQQHLVQSEKMAALGTLVAGVAHEINNPLNYIQGGVDYMESYLTEKNPEQYEELKPVIEGINLGVIRTSDIVKSLKQYSRSDGLLSAKCDLHQIINGCLIILKNQFDNRIELQIKYTEVPFILKGNEGKLHQAFLNILANAGQSIGEKGKITITTEIKNDMIQTTISDNGEGIPQENLKKIIEPFFTTKDPGKGTGLGLSITYNIIKEHNGSIKFESEPGVGTTVIVSLPLVVI